MKNFISVLLCACMLLALPFAASADSYTSAAKGFGGDVTVTVTVEDGKIAAVTAEGISETPSIGGAAMPELAQAMVDAQTPYVDAVAGATLPSNAMIEAAAAACAEAGLSFEKAEAVKGEDETADCDVLVIGMGASGSVAALSAAENGAKVIGIDSSAMLGGMGNAAQGMFAIGTSLQQERYGDNLGSDEEYWYNKFIEQSNMLLAGTVVHGGKADMPTEESMRAAGIMITIIPVLIVYPFVRKYFSKGMVLGAVKG